MNYTNNKFLLIFFLIIIFTILFCLCGDNEFGGIIKIHKHLRNINEKEKFKKIKMYNFSLSIEEDETIPEFIFNRFYYVIIITTTVGFGDIYPISKKAKILTIIYTLILFYIINKV